MSNSDAERRGRMRSYTTTLVVAVFVLAISGCSKKQEQSAGGGAANMALLGSSTGTTAGVRWSVPKRWTEEGERPMRIATYAVPAAEGDPEPGDCGVFYFGNDQGGTVDQNIDRWVGQFETTGVPVRATKNVDGMNVTLVQVSGTYLAPAGPQMQSTGKKENYRLLGAIVQGPQGSVFYKLVGPDKTVAGAEGEFDALIASLTKV
jgi:hypothetical protein